MYSRVLKLNCDKQLKDHKQPRVIESYTQLACFTRAYKRSHFFCQYIREKTKKRRIQSFTHNENARKKAASYKQIKKVHKIFGSDLYIIVRSYTEILFYVSFYYVSFSREYT